LLEDLIEGSARKFGGGSPKLPL